jgi:peptide/nickel transport system permease protein
MAVLNYVARRFGRATVVIGGVTVVTFVLTHIIFNPVNLLLPETASQAQRATYSHSLGLDRPILDQFGSFLAGLAHGNFGRSLWLHAPCLQLVVDRLPASLLLASCAMAVAVILGLAVGILAGTRPGTWLDRVVSGIGAVGLSIPDFWFGIVLILVFAAHLRLLPTSGLSGPESLVLPCATLCLRPASRLAAVARESVESEMRSAYVLSARARGLTTSQVVRRHVLRNISVACTTLIGYDFLFMFTGYAVGVEVVFGWPGVGRLAIDASLNQDVTLLATIVIVTGAIIAVGNAMLEMLHMVIDRRLAT